MSTPKILRITTVNISLEKLITGQIQFMEEHGFEVHTASHGVYNYKNHHQIENLSRSLNPIQDLKALVELIKVMKEFKPDIVHSHTPKAGLLGMLAARLCGVKIRMHTVGGLPLMEKGKIFRNFLKIIERFTYACSTHVYCNSIGLKDYITRKLYYSKKLKIIGKGSTNGIDLNVFNPHAVNQEVIDWHKRELGIKDETVLIYIGRIVRDKGIVELVNSFKQVNLENQKTKLLLVGFYEDDLDPLPKETQETIKFNKDILDLGYQHDVRPYIALSDILVFPSYREGFPNVPLQVGAMQKAMIVSDINGCNEIVEHLETGLLVQPKNEEELHTAMIELVQDKSLRQELASNARKSIESNFEQSVIWNAILKEYNSALEQNL